MRVVVVEPARPVVTFEEVARQLRLDDDEDRELVEMFIAAAQGHIDAPDGWLGRAIGLQTLEATADKWPSSLPYRPISKIVSVTADGVEVSGVGVETDGDLIVPPQTLQSADRVIIRYVAGYEQAPPPIKAAVLLMVGDLYKNRETTSERPQIAIQMSTTVDRLLSRYVVWDF